MGRGQTNRQTYRQTDRHRDPVGRFGEKWHQTCDRWLVTPNIWNVTPDMWHVGEVNLVSNFQLPCLYGLGMKVHWRYFHKGRLSDSMNQLITKVFVEQPPGCTGSVNTVKYTILVNSLQFPVYCSRVYNFQSVNCTVYSAQCTIYSAV